MQTQRRRIAIQKKGRLSKECQDLLKKCGVKFNIMGERLVVHSLNMPIDLLLVRDDDIPGLIMDGVVDLGFIGENELEEVRLDRVALKEPSEFRTLRRLDFGGCRLSIAINKDEVYNGPQDLAGKRIATTYPQLLKAYMDEQGVEFSTCMLTGSVEVAPRAGLADAIADLVSAYPARASGKARLLSHRQHRQQSRSDRLDRGLPRKPRHREPPPRETLRARAEDGRWRSTRSPLWRSISSRAGAISARLSLARPLSGRVRMPPSTSNTNELASSLVTFNAS